MSLVGEMQAWVDAQREALESAGVEIRSVRSPPGRPNPSYALNLRIGVREADFIVWDSGHGDLALSHNIEAEPALEHIANLLEPGRLEPLLDRMLAVLSGSDERIE